MSGGPLVSSLFLKSGGPLVLVLMQIKPGGHWKDFDALKSNFDTLKGNIGA